MFKFKDMITIAGCFGLYNACLSSSAFVLPVNSKINPEIPSPLLDIILLQTESKNIQQHLKKNTLHGLNTKWHHGLLSEIQTLQIIEFYQRCPEVSLNIRVDHPDTIT